MDAGLTLMKDDLLEQAKQVAGTLIFSATFGYAVINEVIQDKWKRVLVITETEIPWTQMEFVNWASAMNHCGVYDPSRQGIAPYLFGKLFSLSQWSNLQYLDMPGFDQVTMKAEWQLIYDRKICFVAGEIGKPELGLFAIGGRAGADAFIRESLKISIQDALARYIKLHNPSYSRREISIFEDIVRNVANTFIANKLITSIQKITIPPIENQLLEDRGNFIVGGLEVDFQEASAVWRIKGTVFGE